jgi:hypothetical protein
MKFLCSPQPVSDPFHNEIPTNVIAFTCHQDCEKHVYVHLDGCMDILCILNCSNVKDISDGFLSSGSFKKQLIPIVTPIEDSYVTHTFSLILVDNSMHAASILPQRFSGLSAFLP